MLLQAVYVCLQVLLSCLLGLGVHVVDESRERHLGVDNHLAPLVKVQDDVGAHQAAFLGLYRPALGVADDGLRVVMDATGKSLRLQQFVKHRFPPVALHLGAVLEHAGQFLGTALRGGALAHHVLDVGAHLGAHGGLLQGVFVHGLFHLLNGFAQGIDYLAQIGVAGFGKLFLALLQHVVGGRLYLGGNFGHHLVKTCLLCRQCFGVSFLLCRQRLPTCRFLGIEGLVASLVLGCQSGLGGFLFLLQRLPGIIVRFLFCPGHLPAPLFFGLLECTPCFRFLRFCLHFDFFHLHPEHFVSS